MLRNNLLATSREICLSRMLRSETQAQHQFAKIKQHRHTPSQTKHDIRGDISRQRVAITYHLFHTLATRTQHHLYQATAGVGRMNGPCDSFNEHRRKIQFVKSNWSGWGWLVFPPERRLGSTDRELQDLKTELQNTSKHHTLAQVTLAQYLEVGACCLLGSPIPFRTLFACTTEVCLMCPSLVAILVR